MDAGFLLQGSRGGGGGGHPERLFPSLKFSKTEKRTTETMARDLFLIALKSSEY